ncbi:MAG: type IV pilus modification protein PilV [Gammaproteobacteria bacterium]|nr:MAG: type IV pilus modification protein PilV [Gammaproteobacteria bacterium]PIE37012.1 MAG: type IV pilus modification protein PilV [Gammaproteobacteria bacterium]
MMHVPAFTAVRKRAAVATQRGVGLIEVLLAVLVLSIGFLASARMQVESMRTAQAANALSQAKFMLLDMSERMRANRQGMRDGNYASITTAADTSEPGCVSNGTPCSAADIALADRHRWSRYLHPEKAGDTNFVPLLPGSATKGARGTIKRDDTTGAHTVTVYWNEPLDGSDSERSLSIKVYP